MSRHSQAKHIEDYHILRMKRTDIKAKRQRRRLVKKAAITAVLLMLVIAVAYMTKFG